MRNGAVLLVSMLALLAAAAPAFAGEPLQPTTPLFTVAGTLARGGPLHDGVSATALRLPWSRIAVRPGDGMLLGTDGGLATVDPAGRLRVLASGIVPDAVAAAPDGGVVFASCDEPLTPAPVGRSKVLRLGPDGTITTLAGSGRPGRPARDGMRAVDASLVCPQDIVVTGDGGVLFDNGQRLFELGTDGRLWKVAGSGAYPDQAIRQAGGPADKIALEPTGLDVSPDGSLLVADPAACRVYRLAAGRLTVLAGNGKDGQRRDDGRRALDARVCAVDVAAAPEGGFYLTDVGTLSVEGDEGRVRLVRPDGRIQTVAGGASLGWVDVPPASKLRGDGMPGPGADLGFIGDIAVLPDGGVAFTERTSERAPALVRYLPPPSGARLAAGVRRDRDRIFVPGAAAFTTVSLTAPADVTVTVLEGTREVARRAASLPAGDSRIELPPLTAVPHTIALTAQDGGGRVADDRAAILPRGRLATSLARSLAEELTYAAHDIEGFSGRAVGRCRRVATGGVDCIVTPQDRCGVIAIRLGDDGRLRWGTYRCPLSGTPTFRKRLRPLRRADIRHREEPLPLLGRVADRWLVPWD